MKNVGLVLILVGIVLLIVLHFNPRIDMRIEKATKPYIQKFIKLPKVVT